MMSLIQTAGIGNLVPNCVLMPWSQSWKLRADVRKRFILTVQTCTAFQKTVMLAKDAHDFALNDECVTGSIDIWWIVNDGGHLLVLPQLLLRHAVWKNCKINLYATLSKGTEYDVDSSRVIYFCPVVTRLVVDWLCFKLGG